MKKIFFFSLLFFQMVHAKNCVPVSMDQFNTVLVKRHEPATLIFFSTWCADCKIEIEKIQKLDNQSAFILVGEFDTIERINRNLSKMKTATDCYFDESGEIRKKFGVKVVPTEIELK